MRYSAFSVRNICFSLCFLSVCGLVFALAFYPPKIVRPKVAANARQIKDMAGKPHTLSASAQRIVFTGNILPPFATLTGTLKSVAGAADYARKGMNSGLLGRIFKDSQNIASAGSSVAPNIEQIFSLKPDAVFGWGFQTKLLQEIAPFDVVSFNTQEPSIPGHITLWHLLGALTGQSAKADALLQTYRERIASITHQLPAHFTQSPRVMILMSNTNALWIGSSHHYLNERLALAGGENPVHGKISTLFSLEDVARLDPDVIIMESFAGDGHGPQELFETPAWQMIRAVREHKVYRVLDLPLFTIPVFDPLLVEWLAELLHSEFGPSSLRDDFRKTYQEVYGYNPSESELDTLLATAPNRASAGYDRFAAPAVNKANRPPAGPMP